MKYLLIAALLFVPVAAGATFNQDGVSIQPVIVACEAQNTPVSVLATYGDTNRHLVLSVNGSIVDHWNNEPSTITKTIPTTVGTYTVDADIYLIEINSTWFIGQLAHTSRTFTVSPCVVTLPATTTPPIITPTSTPTSTPEVSHPTEEVRKHGTSVYRKIFNLTGIVTDVPVMDALQMYQDIIDQWKRDLVK